VMPWTESEHYRDTADRDRLSRVFPVLVAYHRCSGGHRTWRDGTYWTSGWARAWTTSRDTPETGGRRAGPSASRITAIWSGSTRACSRPSRPACYSRWPRFSDARSRWRTCGTSASDSSKRSTGACGTARQVSTTTNCREERSPTLNPLGPTGRYSRTRCHPRGSPRLSGTWKTLRRSGVPHRVPSLSADHPEYREDGGYWLGGVWPPTNYMVLRGLDRAGYHALAHEISREDLDHVIRVFGKTGTVWENYAPERPPPENQPGRTSWAGPGCRPSPVSSSTC
jgi:hypothetical protein